MATSEVINNDLIYQQATSMINDPEITVEVANNLMEKMMQHDINNEKCVDTFISRYQYLHSRVKTLFIKILRHKIDKEPFPVQFLQLLLRRNQALSDNKVSRDNADKQTMLEIKSEFPKSKKQMEQLNKVLR